MIDVKEYLRAINKALEFERKCEHLQGSLIVTENDDDFENVKKLFKENNITFDTWYDNELAIDKNDENAANNLLTANNIPFETNGPCTSVTLLRDPNGRLHIKAILDIGEATVDIINPNWSKATARSTSFTKENVHG